MPIELNSKINRKVGSTRELGHRHARVVRQLKNSKSVLRHIGGVLGESGR